MDLVRQFLVGPILHELRHLSRAHTFIFLPEDVLGVILPNSVTTSEAETRFMSPA